MPTYQYQPTKPQIYDMVNRALNDYQWKGNLKNEGTQRLDMWESAHWGDAYITSGNFQQFKTLTEDSIQREKDYRDSAEKYKNLLLTYQDYFDPIYVQNALDNVDQNQKISLHDQQAAITNYQTIEQKYLNQEEIVKPTGPLGWAIAGIIILWISSKLSGSGG